MLPENDTLIEYTFDGETFLEKGKGIVTGNGSNENSNIKVNLPSKGRIFIEPCNTTDAQTVVFIDTTPNMTNANSSYGSATLEPGTTSYNNGQTWDKLISCELEAGTYYVNWIGSGLWLVNIEVFYEVEKEVEFTGITGEPQLKYGQGDYFGTLNLDWIFLNTTDGQEINLQYVQYGQAWHHYLYWEYIRDNLTIDIENSEEFYEGNPEIGRTFDVTITFGKHSKFFYTITIVDWDDVFDI